jgi:hypothetical protein
LPFPLPFAPLVTVIHDAPLTDVQVHPVATDTATVPVLDPEAIDRSVGEIDGSQLTVKVNWFDTVLAADPPHPTAETRASYVTPPGGSVLVNAEKFTRIFPSVPGVGFPRLIDWIAVLPPTV